ncbi:MAG: DNA mismatch repair protein MutS [Puniceicoccales bacterium]|jgi:DNA mismatch repair protein MutS|nr:DNA mismatch repair protein MutS [Puniceicoccales bacterium]
MLSSTPKPTPMMQQYNEIRASLPEKTLLLYRLGDFYELFDEDAKVGAKVLSIVLTHRGGSPMAGIPYHSAESYISKLLHSGYKVAICDQIGEPKPGQLVKRAISRILTPGTVIADQYIEAKHNNYILSFQLSKRGLAASWIEVSTGEFRVTFAEEAQKLLPVLRALSPAEIIIPDGELEFWSTNATAHKESLCSLTQNSAVSEINAMKFDLNINRELICKMLGVHNLNGYGIVGNLEYTLGPAGALLNYVSENLCTENLNLAGIKVYQLSETMILDSATIRSLELFQSSHFTRSGSLIDTVDRTVTAPGARLLEKFFLYPLISPTKIQNRQNCVQAFVQNLSICKNVHVLLEQTYDLTRIITRLRNRLRNPRELGSIRSTISVLKPLKGELGKFECVEIERLNGKIGTFEDLHRLLSQSLADSLPIDLANGGHIRDGYNAEIDRLRSLHDNCREWMAEFERNEQQKTGIRNLRIKFNGTFGYFIEVTKSNVGLVPSHYVRRQTTVNGERYITEELRKKESEILNAERNAIELESALFDELLAEALKYSAQLQETADALAELDVYCGWARLANEYNYCKPILRDDDRIEIVHGRHPVVEQSLVQSRFVPNSTILNTNDNQVTVITGPNMAGKSTYIRQVALIVFLAHIGSFVPAKSCAIGVVDRIFSRIGSGDDLSQGNSTFMVEMNEMANILNNMTGRSLVIIDEIGRGTSTYDGLSIAWAVVEHLARSTTRTLFATHYHELTKLAESSKKIKNYKMSVKEWNDEIIFMREVVPGAADKSYGIHVARLAGLPANVINRSKEILRELESEGNTLRKTLTRKFDKSEDFQRVLF